MKNPASQILGKAAFDFVTLFTAQSKADGGARHSIGQIGLVVAIRKFRQAWEYRNSRSGLRARRLVRRCRSANRSLKRPVPETRHRRFPAMLFGANRVPHNLATEALSAMPLTALIAPGQRPDSRVACPTGSGTWRNVPGNLPATSRPFR